MSIKTDAQLKVETDAIIVVNGNREITPPLDNSLRTNVIDSKLNINGGNVLIALTGYTTELTPSDNKHLVPKKYVDDTVLSSVSNTIYGVGWDGVTTIAPSKNAVYDLSLLLLPLDGSRDMTGSTNYATDGTGGTWDSGSAIIDTSGVLTVSALGNLMLSSTTGEIISDKDLNFSNTSDGLSWSNDDFLKTVGGSALTLSTETGGNDIRLFSGNTMYLKATDETVVFELSNAQFETNYGILLGGNGSYIKDNADDIDIFSNTAYAHFIETNSFYDNSYGNEWVGGSYIKESAGVLTIEGLDAINITAADVLNLSSGGVNTDATIYFSANSTGLSWDIGGASIQEDTGDLVVNSGGNLRFTSATLSASTLGYLDASSNLVSLANAAGVLRNNGSGTLSYDNTVATSSNNLSFFAATTSAQLAGLISDETGSGSLVFGTSPDFTTSLTTGSTTFSLVNSTATTVNFAGAASVALNIGNASGTNTILGSTILSSLTVASDTDATTILGRSRIHSAVTDRMLISHFDLSGSTNFAVEQLAAGSSKFNAASGQTVALSINRVDKATVSSTDIKIVSGVNFWLGNAATTGLSAGALAATTNASIVIYDSTGQAYRIPCII